MAEKYWYGDGDGDQGANIGKWDYNINWRLCSDNSPSTKPADGDIIHFDNRAYYNTTDGRYQDVTAAQDAAPPPDLDGFFVKATYDGNIGDSDNYAEFHLTGGDFIFEGTGTARIMISKDTADCVCQRIIVNSTGGILYLDAQLNDGSNCNEITDLYGIAGNILLQKHDGSGLDGMGPIVTNLYALGATITADDTVYRNKATAAATIIRMTAGTVYWSAPIDNIVQSGGIFNWGQELAAAPALDIDCDLLIGYNDGVFNWCCRDDTASILEQFKLYGTFTLDASLALNADTPKVIGDAAGNKDSEIWGLCTVKLNNGNQNISFQHANCGILNHGGVVILPDNKEISW